MKTACFLWFYFCRLDDRHIRGTSNSDLKLPPESDTDSIQDYVDGETAGKFQKHEFWSFLVDYPPFILVF